MCSSPSQGEKLCGTSNVHAGKQCVDSEYFARKCTHASDTLAEKHISSYRHLPFRWRNFGYVSLQYVNVFMSPPHNAQHRLNVHTAVLP